MRGRGLRRAAAAGDSAAAGPGDDLTALLGLGGGVPSTGVDGFPDEAIPVASAVTSPQRSRPVEAQAGLLAVQPPSPPPREVAGPPRQAGPAATAADDGGFAALLPPGGGAGQAPLPGEAAPDAAPRRPRAPLLAAVAQRADVASALEASMQPGSFAAMQSQCQAFANYLLHQGVHGQEMVRLWMGTCQPGMATASENYRVMCQALGGAVQPFVNRPVWSPAEVCKSVLQTFREAKLR